MKGDPDCFVFRNFAISAVVEKYDVTKGQQRLEITTNPMNIIEWNHSWDHHQKGIVWDTAAAHWAGKKERLQKRKKVA